MSIITLATVKGDLRVTHNDDDTILQVYLDASEDEVLRFLNRDEMPGLPPDYPEESSSEIVISSESGVAPSIYAAVFLLVRAKYDATLPDEISKLRLCAETLMQPYRIEIGM